MDVIQLLDLEDAVAIGDGGDSDAGGDGDDIEQSFIDGMVEVEMERYNEDGFQIEREVECDDNTAVEGVAVISNKNAVRLWGAPPKWIPPQVPPNWKPDKLQVAAGEPPFDKVDNLGGWSPYTYQAVR